MLTSAHDTTLQSVSGLFSFVQTRHNLKNKTKKPFWPTRGYYLSSCRIEVKHIEILMSFIASHSFV